MSRNVEIKVRVGDLEGVRMRLATIDAEDRGVLRQVDTYFRTPESALRLKLRDQEPGASELIAYSRPAVPGLRTSAYRVLKVTDPAGLRETLTQGLGMEREVRKTRHLFVVGRTRIHLDQVEGLGSFLELEVALEEGEDVVRGEAEAEKILAVLGLERAPLIATSYSNL